ncbi:MAG: porin [Spirochaetes bacterium]|nr:porin [Spirochaetota bacterium]MBN2770581.1 porin [Spirochaetota bacterium]
MKKMCLVLMGSLVLFSSANMFAANLYNADGTVVDLYSRLYAMYQQADQGEITGDCSRLGLQTSTKVNNDLSVFARAEFRYDASQREKETVFNDLRNTYVGVDSSFGKVTVGNFDSVYYQAVSSKLDIYENAGFIALADGSTASRADSVSYSSPDIMGVKIHGQIRHYGQDQTVSGDEKIMFQGGVTFDMSALSLGIAAVIADDKAEAVFNTETDIEGEEITTATAKYSENIYGFSASYTLFEALTLIAMAEYQKDAGEADMNISGGVSYSYGMGDVYASLGQDCNEEIYYALGASWKFSKPMNVFVEYAGGDAVNPDDNIFTAGLRYDF